jgi:ring-1,2-phenylacetyl-CoA epoxidase subunit PaaE
VRRETADAVSIAFDVPEALRDTFAWTPGQHLTLRVVLDGVEVRRTYSICSGLDDGEMRIAVKRLPGGVFSAYASTKLRPGGAMDVMPPAGSFGVLPGAPGRTLLGIAAGSGITPVLSILRSVLSREADSRFVLLYGSRSTAEILFRTALEDLKDRYINRLAVVHLLSREAQDVPILSGRLDAGKLRVLLSGAVPPGAIDHAFICGPPGMIADACSVLAAFGLPPGRVHVERFLLPGTPVRAERRAFAPATAFAHATIIHDGKTRVVPVADGEAILEAALRAGMDLPWSCRGGMCSTCRARLREGEAQMAQNFALEPWETEAGYVLTCQARPTTQSVTVDYDHV